MDSAAVKLLVDEWLSFDTDPETRTEIQKLWDAGDVNELQKILGHRIAFGTAGLRGPMRAGYACMNNLIVKQTSQGICAYILKVFPDVKEKGVVIGFDARYHSHTFARIAASVFIHKKIPVYLFPSICATPHVPFTVRKQDACAGIMVTASHNPKQDNGYKVYWRNSAQIIPPIDANIHESILQNLKPWDCKENDVDSSPLIIDAGKICWDDYREKIVAVLSKKRRFGTSIPPFPIVYTAMHGVGYRFVKEAFSAFGLSDLIPVEEQVEPDPEFPTAPFPNPEEKGTLNLAMKKADKIGIPIIAATDPDSDRFTFAEYNKEKKQWRQFTGDEIGTIFAYRQLTDWKEEHPDGDVAKIAIVNSAVSSQFINVMGAAEGFQTAQTLTGFKWIGNKMLDYEASGVQAVMGYEEAIGYCLGSGIIVDKDGISAASVLGELAAILYSQNKTLEKYMNDIYARYGTTVSNNSYLYCYSPPTITKIFDRIRASGKGKDSGQPDTYIRSFTNTATGEKWEVKHVRDLHTGYDSSTSDKRALLPSSSSSEMLTYYFTNGAVLTIRTSGTEPKVKYYSELTGKDGAECRRELQALVKAVVEECLQPEINGLKPPLG